MMSHAGNFVPDWLDRQCQQFDSAIRAAVLLGETDSGPFQPVAQWPDDSAAIVLARAGIAAIRSRSSVVHPGSANTDNESQAGDILACPILSNDHLLGVVALEVQSGDASEQRKLLLALQANTQSLEKVISSSLRVDEAQSLQLLDLLAAMVEHPEYADSARTVTTKLAVMLGLERVSLGWLEGGETRVDVHSGSATVNPKMLLARTMASAMDEAIAFDQVIQFPDDAGDLKCPAHEKFCKLREGGVICTVPVSYAGKYEGAFLFEKLGSEGFLESELTLMEAAGILIGPLLMEKRLQTRSFWQHLKAGIEKQNALGASGWLRLKNLAIGAILLGVLMLTLIPGDYRVTADALLEGTVQRMVVSPIDGYITEANVRAGDMVREGDLLARLEDKQYELERLTWRAEQDQLQREYREAMAQYDSAQVAIIKARLDSASAQLALAEQNLARTRIVAPMDGVLLSGDLDQSLGAPVKRGELLFEIAPLDAYRVMLEVDERDIGRIQVNQRGSLALVGLPGQRFEFNIERTTPVSTAKEGRNFFYVEADLAATVHSLRPGMAGVGKIEIGREKLIWIYTHEIIEWFRLWSWKWLP